jgi:hypothetical protein
MKVTAGKVAAMVCLATPALWLSSRAFADAPGGVRAGTLCATEQYQWFGNEVLDPNESFGTGIVVPSEPGAQLRVIALDHSTGAVVTDAVSLRVGDTLASNGAVVAGGEITVTNFGGDPVTLTAAGLNIERCHQVDSAAPQQGLQVAARSFPTVNPAPAAPTTPGGAEALPATGTTSAGLVYGAATCTAVGVVLLSISRRRATGFDRAT